MDYSITQNRKPLDPDLYRWNEETKTLSTTESGLVLDFSDYDGVTFKTGYGCTFETGCDCTFETGRVCTFDTSHSCTFKTWDNCTFKTGRDCTFITGHDCTFNTGYDCTFNTGSNCTFHTSHNCTFETEENCVVMRKDIFKVININGVCRFASLWQRCKGFIGNIKTKKIKLNGAVEAGYKIIK
jgi:hypothetical protein